MERAKPRIEVGMRNLLGVEYLPAPAGVVFTFLRKVEELILCSDLGVSKDEVARWMLTVIPGLRHIETGKNLDDRI